ncbi:hypothetical protein VDG1235_4322 [Verrucomicrobiia bacterium DG1235]|nr:hypothetical protein VDG1235_4322 [Verrucomicrobiae bacterium DG1235]
MSTFTKLQIVVICLGLILAATGASILLNKYTNRSEEESFLHESKRAIHDISKSTESGLAKKIFFTGFVLVTLGSIPLIPFKRIAKKMS